MDKQQIKSHLNNNPELIVEVLERINCHHIRIIPKKRVQAALPYPSDNTTSVQIKFDDKLTTKVRSKNDFQNYEVKDIFTLIQYIKKCSFPEAISIVCEVCGIKYESNTKQLQSDSYNFLKRFNNRIQTKQYQDDDLILPEHFKERFIPIISQQYLNDGVNEETQEKYDIRYDLLDNRIVFPIRNEIGSLLTFKGRTCNEEYKIRGIPKFITYYSCFINNYLFGYYQNKKNILETEEVYIVEAEKGVMQLDSMGIYNALAVNKKVITDIQLNKLLKLGKPVVLAFDKDVTLEEIFIECKKFKGLIDVYYIYDTLDLLDAKDSPTDKGLDIFNRLINECKFKFKGE